MQTDECAAQRPLITIPAPVPVNVTKSDAKPADIERAVVTAMSKHTHELAQTLRRYQASVDRRDI